MGEQRTTHPLAVVILAAGKGTRMRSALPKVLHPIAGAPMLHHVMRRALSLSPARLAIVVGHGAEDVGHAAQKLAPDAQICLQEQQLGTGHAVRMAAPALEGFQGDVLILYGDVPFIEPDTLTSLRAGLANGTALQVLGFETPTPGRYGRLLLDQGGRLEAIVEAKDATPDQLAITTCNSGVMAGDCQVLLGLLSQLSSDNAQSEYYLTDCVHLAHRAGHQVGAAFCDETETAGVNDRTELAAAEGRFQATARRQAMLAGATLTDPGSVHFAWDTRLGQDVTVGPNVVFAPGVRVEDGATVEAFCHLADCTIARGAKIGPFARLRGGVEIGADCRVGNFVEMKNVNFGPGAKAAHLTYVGDATVGPGANLGAGTITCNYDGVNKHRTEIGAGAFIGTNTALVAPVSVGDNAYTATGTVVTEDVPEDALAISRAPQQNRAGTAKRLRQKLQHQKAAKTAS